MIDLQADLKTLLASPAVAPWRRALRLRLSERRLLLLCIDLAIVNVVLFLAVGFRTDLSVEAWLWPWNLKWFASLSAIWLVSAILFDLYDLARASDTEKSAAIHYRCSSDDYLAVCYHTVRYTPATLAWSAGIFPHGHDVRPSSLAYGLCPVIWPIMVYATCSDCRQWQSWARHRERVTEYR